MTAIQKRKRTKRLFVISSLMPENVQQPVSPYFFQVICQFKCIIFSYLAWRYSAVHILLEKNRGVSYVIGSDKAIARVHWRAVDRVPVYYPQRFPFQANELQLNHFLVHIVGVSGKLGSNRWASGVREQENYKRRDINQLLATKSARIMFGQEYCIISTESLNTIYTMGLFTIKCTVSQHVNGKSCCSCNQFNWGC